jgi:hypothetical protein
MRRLIMKMLLASNDIPALQPITARLVVLGIPIALLNPTDISSYLEVWIQRDSDFSLARTLLTMEGSAASSGPSSAITLCSGHAPRNDATESGALNVTSSIGRFLCRLRQWRQTWRPSNK